jgi:hypothetical protein
MSLDSLFKLQISSRTKETLYSIEFKLPRLEQGLQLSSTKLRITNLKSNLVVSKSSKELATLIDILRASQISDKALLLELDQEPLQMLLSRVNPNKTITLIIIMQLRLLEYDPPSLLNF